MRLVAEQKIVSKFFENIAMDSGLVIYGVEDTMKALERGLLERMILFEDIKITRYSVRDPSTGKDRALFLN